MAAPSSILAWRVPRTEEPGGLQSMGSQESDTTEATSHTCTLIIYKQKADNQVAFPSSIILSYSSFFAEDNYCLTL